MNAAPAPGQLRTVPTQDGEAARAAKTVLDWLDRGAPRQSLPAPELRTLAALATDSGEEDHCCSICAEPFKADDICASDIELGICHAACLEGCPTVDLETSEPVEGPIPTYIYGSIDNG